MRNYLYSTLSLFPSLSLPPSLSPSPSPSPPHSLCLSSLPLPLPLITYPSTFWYTGTRFRSWTHHFSRVFNGNIWLSRWKNKWRLELRGNYTCFSVLSCHTCSLSRHGQIVKHRGYLSYQLQCWYADVHHDFHHYSWGYITNFQNSEWGRGCNFRSYCIDEWLWEWWEITTFI